MEYNIKSNIKAHFLVKEKKMEDHIKLIWDVLETFDKWFGNFYFLDRNQLSKGQKIYNTFWFISYCLFIFMTIYTAIKKTEDLQVVFMSINMGVVFIFGFIQNLNVLFYKSDFKKVLQWCKEVHGINKPQMNETCISTAKFLKYLRNGFIFTFLMNTIGLLIVNYLKPGDSIYRPPQPFILPFEDQERWYVFLITVIVQASADFYGGLFGVFNYGMLVISFKTFQGYLDMICEQVRNLNVDERLSKSKFNTRIGPIIEDYCKTIE